MRKINILIVDDEALIREGMRALLAREKFCGEIFEASDADQFFECMENEKIDLVLLDIFLRKSTGVELLQYMNGLDPRPKVVAVTGREGAALIVNLLKLGVDGIVYKLDGYNEIRKTIESIVDGGSYFPTTVLHIIRSNAALWEKTPAVVLGSRDRDILRALARGAITKEIAWELKMTEATAETYRLRLIRKVGVSNTAALLAYAFRNGIL